ncbi:hypothetical protein [Rhizobium sp. 18065]|uniref:hypothetical protein n=1 Tax=Rhizobium sp. 18065 TaxID=2681411 RepID=UPI00135A1C21|nr:hypothetical protein [Rhizobium sp. 18065]
MKICAVLFLFALGYAGSCVSAAAEDEPDWIKRVNSTFCPTSQREQEWTTYGDSIYVGAFLDEGSARTAVSIREVKQLVLSAHRDREQASISLYISLDNFWDEKSNASLLIYAVVSPFIVLQRSLLAGEVLSNIPLIQLNLHAIPKIKYFQVEREDKKNLRNVADAYIASPLIGMDPYQKALIPSASANLKSLIINCINMDRVDIYIEDTGDGYYFDGTVDLATCVLTILVLNKGGGSSYCGGRGAKRSCPEDGWVPVQDDSEEEVCAKLTRYE